MEDKWIEVFQFVIQKGGMVGGLKESDDDKMMSAERVESI